MACCSQTARQPRLLEFEISGDDACFELDAAAKRFDLNSEFDNDSGDVACLELDAAAMGFDLNSEFHNISGDDAGIVLDAAAKSFDLNSEFEPTSMSHGCVCRGVRGPSRLTSQ